MLHMITPTERYLSELLATPERSDGVVAFFDLDRTLIDGYSLTALAWQQFFNGNVGPRRFMSLATMFTRYGVGRIDYGQMLGATVKDITGMPETELAALGQQAFSRWLTRRMFKEGFDLVDAHRGLGHDVVLVTSATVYQAAPIAEALGIEHLRCTELTIVDGCIAGDVVPCYGIGKRNAAQQYTEQVGVALDHAYFYSDSHDDLPLLEAVGKPVMVNAKPALVRIGAPRGWPHLAFREKSRFDPGAVLPRRDTGGSAM
jgi:putative phosphoserine phosphatase/1-acylglycerol-3-phosphate O-acyltransferase